MQIVFNGEPRKIESTTVSELLRELELEGRKVALEVNRTVVPRDSYAVTPLAEGDEIELIQFVGGG